MRQPRSPLSRRPPATAEADPSDPLVTLQAAATKGSGLLDLTVEHQEDVMARRTATPMDQVVQDAEKARRRHRTENGRSPAQLTTRSRDDYRATKRPGQRERRQTRQSLRQACHL